MTGGLKSGCAVGKAFGANGRRGQLLYGVYFVLWRMRATTVKSVNNNDSTAALRPHQTLFYFWAGGVGRGATLAALQPPLQLKLSLLHTPDIRLPPFKKKHKAGHFPLTIPSSLPNSNTRIP